MQGGPSQTSSEGDRAASELLGYVLLLGMVITAAGMVAFLGTPIINDTLDQQSRESAEITMQETNARLGPLSTKGVPGATEFSFGKQNNKIQGEPKLQQNEGHVKITVNGNSTCSIQEQLDLIRVNNTKGEQFIYEAGGIWGQSKDKGLWSVEPPDFRIQNGHIDISLKNLTGTISSDSNDAVLNPISSRNDTNDAIETLLQGDCQRPDNVTIKVNSEFYEGWATHFRVETGYRVRGSAPSNGDSYVTKDDGTETATLYLNQDALPPETDDKENPVLDVTNDSSYMEDVEITSDGISVDKGSSNEYNVFVEPIGDVNIGKLGNITISGNMSRRPIDVMFVMDESGSMKDAAGSGFNKSEAAQNAMQKFTTYMIDSYDRVGLVGYYNTDPSGNNFIANVYRTNELTMSYDFHEFNNTVEKINAAHGTLTTVGIKRAEALLSLHSNEDRDDIIVMLTDGKNEFNESRQAMKIGGQWYNGSDAGNKATKKVARIANESGKDVYTIGFAKDDNDINETFLENTANVGGGEYYRANNSSELEDAFEDIAERVNENEVKFRTPISTNITEGSEIHPPESVEDWEEVSNITIGGEEFYNINDPKTPSQFNHAFSISGGEQVNFEASTYGCDNWTVSRPETIDGEEYPVLRCADMNSSENPISAKEVYTSEDDSSFTNMLQNTDHTEQQTNLTQAVTNRSLYNATTNELTLDSNQALVLYDFPDGTHTDNRMLVLYTVGYSDDYRPNGVIDVNIGNIEIES